MLVLAMKRNLVTLWLIKNPTSCAHSADAQYVLVEADTAVEATRAFMEMPGRMRTHPRRSVAAPKLITLDPGGCAILAEILC